MSKLSGPASFGSGLPITAAAVASRSTWQISSLDTFPAGIVPRPASDERDAMPALVQAALESAERAVALVPARVGRGAVHVAVVHHPAVVAGEDDERVVGQLVPVELGEDLADAPVELLDAIAAKAVAALALEPRVRHARNVGVVRGEVEEERLRLVVCDERHGPLRDVVGHVLVLPPRRLAAGHPADAADAVDDGHVVPACSAASSSGARGSPCRSARRRPWRCS